jgi:hypothetical protein
LKKRTKKLFLLAANIRASAGSGRQPQEQKFFGSFFQKRTLASFSFHGNFCAVHKLSLIPGMLPVM